MFFTNLARIIAIGAFVIGLLSILIGLAITMELLGPYAAAVKRYGRSAARIDLAIYAVVVSVALGTLAELSLSMRKRSENSN